MGLTNCKKFAALWGCAVLALVIALGFVPQAYADEPAIVADFDVITVEAQPHGLNYDGWSATVSYARPVAGAPTQFTITADGGPKGSGAYQYQQGFIYKYDPYVWVYDPSFGGGEPYQDSNVLSYQFVGAGRYQYQFQVRDTQTNLFQRFSFIVEVSGEGFIDADAKAQEIVAECLPDGHQDDYETALVLHDWVIDNVSYDHSYRNLGVDRALAGMAVTCEGYHAAYVKLLEAAGMEVGRIADGGHVWTAVKMDGSWYHVDTTHDDVKDSLTKPISPGFPTKEQQAHMLFGLDDATMMLINDAYKMPTAGYEANSLENNYFIKTGDIVEWSDPVASQILAKLEQKEASFTIKPANTSWDQKSYRDTINSLVAYELNQYEWVTDGQQAEAVVRVDYVDGVFAVNVFTVLVSEPVVSRNLVYNGATQVGVTVPSTGRYALTGTTKAAKAGTYTAKVMPGEGYAWDKLGDKKSRSYQWTIAPAPIGSRGVVVSGVQPSYKYTGSAVMPVPRLAFNGSVLKSGVDYTVSYTNNVDAGTATMAITGKGNFQGTQKITFSIEKATAAVAPSQSAWKKSGGKWWYRHADGSYTRNGWEHINGAWYHFDRAGWMQTGWLKSGGKWYYLSGSGAMKTGWLKTGGKWYYLKSSGVMAAGWYKVGNAWYWSNSSGAMGSNRWVGNYYLTASGAMATNTWIGKYHVDGSGKRDKTR